MKILSIISHILYSFTFNFFEFIFFFHSYWWWKLQWLLFVEYLTTSSYKIFKEEKHYTKDLIEDNFSFGETTILSTKLILQEIDPKKGSLVYDLGSGRGTFLFGAHFIYDLQGVGVELFPTYIEKSKKIQRALKTGSIVFQQGNITDIALGDADIIYIAGATFEDRIINKIFENVNQIKLGSIVISVRKPMNNNAFVKINEGNYPFSWGTDYVYFYKKI